MGQFLPKIGHRVGFAILFTTCIGVCAVIISAVLVTSAYLPHLNVGYIAADFLFGTFLGFVLKLMGSIIYFVSELTGYIVYIFFVGVIFFYGFFMKTIFVRFPRMMIMTRVEAANAIAWPATIVFAALSFWFGCSVIIDRIPLIEAVFASLPEQLFLEKIFAGSMLFGSLLLFVPLLSLVGNRIILMSSFFLSVNIYVFDKNQSLLGSFVVCWLTSGFSLYLTEIIVRLRAERADDALRAAVN